jgi:hypothetical protein
MKDILGEDRDSLMRSSYYTITRNFTKTVNRFVVFKEGNLSDNEADKDSPTGDNRSIPTAIGSENIAKRVLESINSIQAPS